MIILDTQKVVIKEVILFYFSILLKLCFCKFPKHASFELRMQI